MSGIATALVAVRFVHFASTLGLFGALLFGAYAGAAGAAVAPLLRRRLIAAAALALGSALAWLVLEAASFSDAWSAAMDPDTIGAVLNETSFGRLWSARLAGTALCLGLALAPGGFGRDLCLGLVAAGLAASLGLTGHAAMEMGAIGLFHRINDASHLLAAGAWLGGLWPLGLTLRGNAPAVEQALRRFSALGIGVVLLILTSGAVNAWFLVGGWTALWRSDYGQVLMLKLLLVAALLALAAVNRLVLLPRLEAPGIRARLSYHVLAEQGLGLAILLVVSLLGTMPPAGSGPS